MPTSVLIRCLWWATIRVKEKQKTKEKEKVRDGKEKVRSEGALDQRLRVSAMVP